MSSRRNAQALELMIRFAERTGVTGECEPRRYLWTDAFAVCNFFGLERATGDGRCAELALRLLDQVHHTLGQHRPDDARRGWLSGLGQQEGEAHPTRGGLRIGKPLPERRPGEPPDDRLEWERDGQYFHYLTRWMHALDQTARATGQPVFNTWGRELANVAHRAFTVAPRSGGPRRMHWKRSIDLSRPLVESMGQHDPLDGFVTCVQLDATAAAMGTAPAAPSLAGAAHDFAQMIEPHALATADPLGLGGLLIDACRLGQLAREGVSAPVGDLQGELLRAALIGLSAHVEHADLRSPTRHRLAFRELGLAIGMAGVALLEEQGRPEPEQLPLDHRAAAHLARLARYLPLRSEIESFWTQPEHRRAETWLEHEDISDVMLATSLVPDGFLVVRPPAR